MVFLGNEFINLYSVDNPILETGDTCYFLMNNNIDYHRPLVIKGIIKHDRFVDGGMNKNYYIQIIDILESPKTINNFLIGKPIDVYPFVDDIIKSKKIIQLNQKLDINNFLIKVEAFFVRKTEDDIKKLRFEYIQIIKKDINKMLSDIEEI